MTRISLKAEKRNLTGRKVKQLRSEGILPGNVYGRKIKSLSIGVKLDEFKKVFSQVGETRLLELQVGSESRPVLIHKVQSHPVTDKLIHADFLQVDLKEKVTAEVPVELIGESPAEKQGLGTVVQYIDKIEVQALPEDLPNKFEVDLSKLAEVDQAVHIKDLPIDKKKVEIKVDSEQIIIKVETQKIEEEVAPAPTAEEVPAEGAVTETPADEKAPTGETSQDKKEGQ